MPGAGSLLGEGFLDPGAEDGIWSLAGVSRSFVDLELVRS